MFLYELQSSSPTALYHATLRDNAPFITRQGLQPVVGSWVKTVYGDHAPIPLVYAASAQGGREKLLSTLAHHVSLELNKKFYEITRAELVTVGTIGIIETDVDKFTRSGGYAKPHLGLERGDYYATEPVRVDRFMSPQEVQKFLGRQLSKVPNS